MGQLIQRIVFKLILMVFYLKQTWLRWLDQNIIHNIASAYETNTILQCFTLQLRGKVSRRFTVLFYINFRLLSIENHITINHILDLKTNDSLVKKLSSLIFSHNINFYTSSVKKGVFAAWVYFWLQLLYYEKDQTPIKNQHATKHEF